MKQATLVTLATDKVSPLPAKCQVGSNPRNNLVVGGSGVLPNHCVIWRGVFGAWHLRQLGARERDRKGEAVPSAVIRRRGGTTYLLPGDRLRLKSGDEITFGKRRSAGHLEFPYTFQLTSKTQEADTVSH